MSGWSLDFIRAISARNRSVILEARGRSPSVSDAWSGIGRPWAVGTVARAGEVLPGLDPTSLQIASTTVRPQSWDSQGGGLSFDVVDSPRVIEEIRKGQLVEMYMGFPGWPPADYARIAFGFVDTVQSQVGHRYTVRCQGWQQLLIARISGVPRRIGENTVSTTVAVQADTATDAFISVADVTGFELVSGDVGGISFVVSGTEYRATYTGTGTAGPNDRINGITYTTLDTGKPATIPIGTTITRLVHTRERLDVALARVLTSTGAGTNGGFDNLPDWHGIGLPASLIDSVDYFGALNRFTSVSPGTLDVSLWAPSGQSSGYTWLTSILSPLGAWIAERQGALTLRLVCDPDDAPDLYTLTDRDIATVDGVDIYSPVTDSVYRTHKIRVGPSDALAVDVSIEGTSQAQLASAPAQDEIVHDMSDAVRTNTAAIANDASRRLRRWDWQEIETIQLTLQGWRWSTLSVGDWVRVTSEKLVVRRLLSSYGAHQNPYRVAPPDRTRYMVLEVSPFAGADTVVTLARPVGPSITLS